MTSDIRAYLFLTADENETQGQRSRLIHLRSLLCLPQEPEISALIPCFNKLPDWPVPPTPAPNTALAQLVADN